MTLLNTIILPFQAGYENIITASSKPRELSVAKRVFENSHYQYKLQSDNSLFSWQGRVSMFVKGVILCLPFIGHITSIALRCFSSSIFPEMPLDFAIKCSPKEQLDIAKCFYTHKPKNVDEALRLTLAKILANDATGLDLLVVNISYLDLMTDTEFSLELIRENPEVLNQINDNITFAQQLFRLEKIASPEDKSTIAQKFADFPVKDIPHLELMENEELALAIIRKNPEVLKLINHSEFRKILESSELSAFLLQNLAKTSAYKFSKKILNLSRNAPPEDKLTIAKQFYLHKPEICSSWRLALAKILADDEEGLDHLRANLFYLDLGKNPKFSISIVQGKPELLNEIESHNPSFFEDLTKNFDRFLPLIRFDNEEFALAIIQKKPEVLNEINLCDHEVANRILDLLEHFTPEQKLAAAKQFYRDKPEIDRPDRLALAEILAADKEGLALLLANLSYLGLEEDTDFFLEFIQKKPKVLEHIITNPQISEQIFAKITDQNLREIVNDNIINFLENSKSHIAEQLLQKQAMDYRFIANWLDSLRSNEDLIKVFIRELILQTRKVEPSDQMKLAIIYALTTLTNNDFIEDLLKDKKINIHLANILLRDEDSRKLVIDNIQYLDLLQNTRFSQKLFQVNPIPEQIRDCFATQILQQDPTDREFIISLFDSLNFNSGTCVEIIDELLQKMDSSSDQMQIAIAHTIKKRHPETSNFLLTKAASFTHTQEFKDFLVEIPGGQLYIKDNSSKFDLLDETV